MNQVKEAKLQLFVSFGLTLKEAIIYEMLLDKGEMAASKIEVETGYKKNTYQILRLLLKKNLVLKKVRETHVFYEAASPEEFRSLIYKQMRSVQVLNKHLIQEMPSLLKSYEINGKRPVLRYIEGADELRLLYKELYAELVGDTYGCIDLEKMKAAIPNLMNEELIPTRNHKSSTAYAVIADNPEGEATARRDVDEGRKSILLDPVEYPLPAEISVYNDKVVLMSFSKGKVKGFVIRDPDMVESLRSIYRYIFDRS